MPDQPEPSTVESGQVTVVPVVELHPTEDLSGASNGNQMSGDDGEYVSLDELKKMSLEDLQAFVKSNELDAPPEALNNSTDLLDWLLSEFGVDA